MTTGLVVGLIVIGLAIWLISQLRSNLIDRRRSRVGKDAESKVAATLASLPRYGHYYVFEGLKDVSGRGDIDHLVIGPPGIFLVETKGHRCEVSADYSADPPLLLRDGWPFEAGKNGKNAGGKPKSFLYQLDREIGEIKRNIVHPYKQRKKEKQGKAPWVEVEGRVCFTRAEIAPERDGGRPPRVSTLAELIPEITSSPPTLTPADIDLLADVARGKYAKAPKAIPKAIP